MHEPPLPPSLWADTAPPAPSCPPLAGDADTDVAVVGAGFTGLSAALHLAGDGVGVRVLDAGEPGWGASGRNGGQVNAGFKAAPAAVRAHLGEVDGPPAIALGGGAPAFAFDLVDRLGIDCAVRRAGHVQGGIGRGAMRRIDEWVAQWRALGAPVHRLGRDEIAAITGTGVYDGGLLDERGGSVQPLAFARGLARAALAAGAMVHGASRVHAIDAAGNGFVLRTRLGALRAQRLLLCTNGYTDTTWPRLAREVVSVKSVICATAPLPDDLRRSILPGGQHVSETTRVPAYYRLDDAGRFLFGGRGDVFGAPEDADDRGLRATATRWFPQLAAVDWQYRWGGYVAMTPEAMPRLVRLAPRAWAGLGFNGRGVAMGTAMGRELALAARGLATTLPVRAPAPIPGHALRLLAVAARVAWGRALDAAELRARA